MSDQNKTLSGLMQKINSMVFPMIGIVTEVDDDGSKHPKGIYPSVKAKFMEVGQHTSPWIRWGEPKTGPGTGTYWIPDIGDEIIVFYTMGSVQKPLCAMSFWNGVDKPPAGYKKDIHGWKDKKGNFLKVRELDDTIDILLSTEDGYSIHLDKTGKKTEIKTADGHRISMLDQGQRIEVQSKGGHILTMDDRTGQRQTKIVDPTGNYFIIDTESKEISMYQILGSFVKIDPTGSVIAKSFSGATMSLSSAGIATMMSAGGMFSVNQFGNFSGLSAGGVAFESYSSMGKDYGDHDNDFYHTLELTMPDGSYIEFETEQLHDDEGRKILEKSHIDINAGGAGGMHKGFKKVHGYERRFEWNGSMMVPTYEIYKTTSQLDDSEANIGLAGELRAIGRGLFIERKINRDLKTNSITDYRDAAYLLMKMEGQAEPAKVGLYNWGSASPGEILELNSRAEMTVAHPDGPYIIMHPTAGNANILIKANKGIQMAANKLKGSSHLPLTTGDGSQNNLWHTNCDLLEIKNFGGKVDIQALTEINITAPKVDFKGAITIFGKPILTA